MFEVKIPRDSIEAKTYTTHEALHTGAPKEAVRLKAKLLQKKVAKASDKAADKEAA